MNSCPNELAFGRCTLRSCSSSHERFCYMEEILGRCNRRSCNSRHKNTQNIDSVPPLCKSWQEGKCLVWRCKDRHYYTDDDEVLQQSKRFSDVDLGVGSSRQTSFSSPYCVKIKKEVIEKRKVEVDLETGRKKSWVESLEQEVLDLTGEASAKKQKMVRSPMMDRTNFLNVYYNPHNVQSRISKRSSSKLPRREGLRMCKDCNFYFCKC